MSKIIIRQAKKADVNLIYQNFKGPLWNKKKSLYVKYFNQQIAGKRVLLVAFVNKSFAGYGNLVWRPYYLPFKKKGIPEIQDLNVLHKFRKQGVGSSLIKACEKIAKRANKKIIGIGVGITKDYGNAMRLYPQLRYIFDGTGVDKKNELHLTKLL